MIVLGNYNTLEVIRRTEHGIYLAGDDRTGDILLPQRYVTSEMYIGQQLEVFVYLDQDERIVATTERPLATVGQFAWLRVAWINQYGAFLHWGLQKDLFCPFREQKQRMELDRSYIVYVMEDEKTHRLMATAKVERHLQPVALSQPPTQGGQEVTENKLPSFGGVGGGSSFGGVGEAPSHGQTCDCLVWQKTDLGYKVIVDNRYQGHVYDNQIFQPLRPGDRLTAYIDHVRQDGKIDVTLQPTGRQHTLDFAEVLLRYLYENNGHCDLDDHSPAELIADRFKVSKKAYKRAIGDLYRRRLIVIDDKGIHLTPNA